MAGNAKSECRKHDIVRAKNQPKPIKIPDLVGFNARDAFHLSFCVFRMTENYKLKTYFSQKSQNRLINKNWGKPFLLKTHSKAKCLLLKEYQLKSSKPKLTNEVQRL